MVKPIEEKLQCLSTWTTVIFVITVLVLVITICNVVLTLSIRNNSIPHTYQIFGTGSDVEPGPGLPPPFSPTFGALAKGSFTVGDCCLKWELLYLNFTQLPTSLNLHGLLYKDNDTAPMLENLIGMEDKELPDGFLIGKKCFEITYELEHAIISRPEDFYLQINTLKFSDGAVRMPLGTRG